MAWISGTELASRLLGGTDVHGATSIQSLIDEAVDHLREASGTTADASPPQTATAREFVREYASGHAYRNALRGGNGVLDEESVGKLLDRADKLLDRYDAAHETAEEQQAEAPAAYTGWMW